MSGYFEKMAATEVTHTRAIPAAIFSNLVRSLAYGDNFAA